MNATKRGEAQEKRREMTKEGHEKAQKVRTCPK